MVHPQKFNSTIPKNKILSVINEFDFKMNLYMLAWDHNDSKGMGCMVISITACYSLSKVWLRHRSELIITMTLSPHNLVRRWPANYGCIHNH